MLASHLSSTLPTPLSQSALQSILNNPIAARQTLDAPTLSLVIDGYRRGFRVLFIVCAALCACAFVATLVWMPHITLKRADDDVMKAEAKEELEKRKKEKRERGEGVQEGPGS